MEPLVFGLCMTLLIGISQQSPLKKFPLRSGGRRKTHNDQFLEEKLIEQNEALEVLLKNVQRHEDLTKKLLDTLSAKLEEPKPPEKTELLLPNTTTLASGRRTFEETTLYPFRILNFSVAPKINETTVVAPWCRNAVLCKPDSIDPVCGYDEKYGVGKFHNVCHMLHVNCYWKYNFTLVPSCKLN